jgi:hypothetical protein
MKELAEDDQNVHTPEVKTGVNTVIRKIEKWARQRGVRTERDLAGCILRQFPDPDITQRAAIEHLMNCYRWNDNTEMFGVTYPQLASWVWARIQLPHEHKDLLFQRFFEEVSASSGQCLNGNMVRLMNTFACIDKDLSYQSAPSLQDLMAALGKEVEEGLPIRIGLERAEVILREAGLTDMKDMDPWFESICEAGADLSDARMYQYYFG